jgi:hypothetical protein
MDRRTALAVVASAAMVLTSALVSLAALVGPAGGS